MEYAGYQQTPAIKGSPQGAPDRAFTRSRYDVCKMVENNAITTGPSRYTLGVPNAYGNAVFVPNPTIRMQLWGASHDMSSTKTDVESDLLNLSRPNGRVPCGQYQAGQDSRRTLTAMPEREFPQVDSRLVDPPCTLRGSGWNRWSWLCEDPQAAVMMPFEHQVDSRHAARDVYYAKLQSGGINAVAAPNSLLCGQMYVNPSRLIPAQRPQSGTTFTDEIPNANTRASTGFPPSATYPIQSQSQYKPQQGSITAVPVPTGAAKETMPTLESQYVAGRLVPPPPFSSQIAAY